MREVSLHFVRWLVRSGMVAVCALSPITAAGAGDNYSHRPIHIVLAQAPAAVVDGVTRQIADKLAATLGVPLVVENRPGASGNIASEYVAKQMPDGYTFLVGATGMTTLPTTLGSQAVDPLRALTPVCKLIMQPIVIVVHPDSHINSLDELLQKARRDPGGLSYSTAGVGTADHLVAVVLTMRASVAPPEIMERMHRELAKALTLRDVREALAAKGVEPVGNSPQEFAEEIRVGLRMWPPILRAAGLARD